MLSPRSEEQGAGGAAGIEAQRPVCAPCQALFGDGTEPPWQLLESSLVFSSPVLRTGLQS